MRKRKETTPRGDKKESRDPAAKSRETKREGGSADRFDDIERCSRQTKVEFTGTKKTKEGKKGGITNSRGKGSELDG